MGLNFKGASKVRASLVSHPTGNGVVAGETGFVDGLVDHKTRIEIQPDVIGFGTLAAEIIPMTGDFFDDEYDLDHPTEGFASIPEAIEDIHQGKDAKHGTTTEASVDLAVLAGLEPVAVLCEIVDRGRLVHGMFYVQLLIRLWNMQGEIGGGQDILVRVHSECLTGYIFGSTRCDCRNQWALAMKQIEATGQGVLVYLRGHEGRGIGVGHKA
ncbi:hypothetical protein V6N13_133184 [Hibiscus sabdariffa]